MQLLNFTSHWNVNEKKMAEKLRQKKYIDLFRGGWTKMDGLISLWKALNQQQQINWWIIPIEWVSVDNLHRNDRKVNSISDFTDHTHKFISFHSFRLSLGYAMCPFRFIVRSSLLWNWLLFVLSRFRGNISSIIYDYMSYVGGYEWAQREFHLVFHLIYTHLYSTWFWYTDNVLVYNETQHNKK